MREGTGNFQNGDLHYMATHPIADAIRIGRTKPYDCSYPAMAENEAIEKLHAYLECESRKSKIVSCNESCDDC